MGWLVVEDLITVFILVLLPDLASLANDAALSMDGTSPIHALGLLKICTPDCHHDDFW